jgi:hypothetical protein
MRTVESDTGGEVRRFSDDDSDLSRQAWHSSWPRHNARRCFYRNYDVQTILIRRAGIACPSAMEHGNDNLQRLVDSRLPTIRPLIKN